VLLIDTSVSWAALAIPLTLLLLFLLLPHRERFCFILDLLCDQPECLAVFELPKSIL
jgi:hypothetical protein